MKIPVSISTIITLASVSEHNSLTFVLTDKKDDTTLVLNKGRYIRFSYSHYNVLTREVDNGDNGVSDNEYYRSNVDALIERGADNFKLRKVWLTIVKL
tara:strand:- start:98 stop:391 length:294 start_codon:yes stop_codon:yes gene_type:complete